MKSFSKKINIAVLFFLLFLSFPASAQRELEAEYPEAGGTSLDTVATSLPEYVKYIFNFAIWIAGALSLFFLVYGGFLYLTSAGSPQKMQGAKDQIIASLLGMAILGGSYALLNTINPALTEFKVPNLEKFEIPEVKKFEFDPEILTEISVEIPPETIIEENLFGQARLERISAMGEGLVELSESSFQISSSLQSNVSSCKCNYGEDPPQGCTEPICEGECKKKELENGKIECVDNCRGKICTSDPCCQVRAEIDLNKTANRKNITEGFMPLIETAEKEVFSLNLDIDRLKKSVSLMDDCDIWNIKTFDQFESSKGYYLNEEDLKVKQVRYWEGINPKDNPVSFYCAVGGTVQDYSAMEDLSNLSEEEIEEMTSIYDQSLLAEEETEMSCSIPIPFGELVDKSMATTTELIGEIEKIIQVSQDMIEGIDLLHQKVSECTSINCKPICCCKGDCECTPCTCRGNPCPNEEIRKAASKLQETLKEAEKIQKKIKDIIEQGIPEIKESLEKLEERTHVCISEEKVAPGAIFLECERSIDAIGPGGNIIQNPSLCSCAASEVCMEDFPTLKNYSCQVLGNCTDFNFFCCRIKD